MVCRFRVLLAFLIGVSLLAGAPLRAEPPTAVDRSGQTETAKADPSRLGSADALTWLMEQPATLYDLGLYQLKQDLARTAQRLRDVGYADSLPASGAYFDWRSKRTWAYISFRDRLNEPTSALCQEVFARMVQSLTEGGPQGPGRAAWYLEALFHGSGFGQWFRPRGLGEKLVEQIGFEVVVLPMQPMSGNSVHCSGPLDAQPEELLVDAR
ncbi:MAG: hypothetical protein ACPGNT_03725 [Rhodospirillales bacterium]